MNCDGQCYLKETHWRCGSKCLPKSEKCEGDFFILLDGIPFFMSPLTQEPVLKIIMTAETNAGILRTTLTGSFAMKSACSGTNHAWESVLLTCSNVVGSASHWSCWRTLLGGDVEKTVYHQLGLAMIPALKGTCFNQTIIVFHLILGLKYMIISLANFTETLVAVGGGAKYPLKQHFWENVL